MFLGAVAAFLVHLRLANKGKPVQPLTARRATVVLCIGDSLTADSFPGRLEEKLNKAGIDAQVLNYGVPGFTSGEYLDYMKSAQVLETLKPDIVLLQLGTNDARADFNHTSAEAFDRNMREIVRLITAPAAGSPPALLIALVPPVAEQFPSFSRKSVQRIAGEINPAIRRIAEDRRLVLVDNHALFVDRPDLIEGIHPTQDGYQAMADNWFEALARNRIVKGPEEKK